MAKGPQNKTSSSAAKKRAGQDEGAKPGASERTARPRAKRARASKHANDKPEGETLSMRNGIEDVLKKSIESAVESALKAALEHLFEDKAKSAGSAPDPHAEPAQRSFGAAAPDAPSSKQTGGHKRRPSQALHAIRDGEDYLDFLTRMFDELPTGGYAEDYDDMSQGVSMVLGSGPAFAALESMMSNVSAQGAVLMNAVQTQRQLDQVGLCCTSACVKQLMNMNETHEPD